MNLNLAEFKVFSNQTIEVEEKRGTKNMLTGFRWRR